MAQSQVVDWVLNLKGDFLAKSQQAKTALRDLAKEAGDVSRKLNQNQLISQFETLSSLLIQVGGNVSQLGILMSSLARPVGLLSHFVGGSTLAMAGMAAGAVLLGAALVKGAFATREWVGEMTKIRTELIQQGYLSHNAAENLRIYEQSANRLEISLKKVKVALADQLAPAFTEVNNAATGFLRQLEDINGKGITATGTLDKMRDTLLGMGGMYTQLGAGAGMLSGAIQYFGMIGKENDRPTLPPQLRGDPRSLLAPLGPAPFQFWDQLESNPDPQWAMTPADRASVAPWAGPIPDFPAQSRLDEAKAKEAQRKLEQTRKELVEGVERTLREGYVDDGSQMLEYLRMMEDARKRPGDIYGGVTGVGAGIGGAVFSQMLTSPAYSAPIVSAVSAGVTEALDQSPTFGRAPGSGGITGVGADAMASAASGGGLSGVLSAAGAGPWGMVISAVASGGIGKAFEGLFDDVMKVFTTLPDQIDELVGRIVPEMIRAAPEMAASFAVLGPAIALSLVENAPALFSALIDAILSLPQAFADAAARSLTPSFLKGDGGLTGNTGGGVGAAVGGLLGLAVGGPFGALLGAGLGAAVGNQAGRGHGGGNHRSGGHVFNVVSNSPRDLMRQMREQLGSFGTGERLDPFAT